MGYDVTMMCYRPRPVSSCTFSDFSDVDRIVSVNTETIAMFPSHQCYLGYISHVMIT